MEDTSSPIFRKELIVLRWDTPKRTLDRSPWGERGRSRGILPQTY